MMSNQLHNPSTFEHLVRSYSEVGDEHANISVLKIIRLHKGHESVER